MYTNILNIDTTTDEFKKDINFKFKHKQELQRMYNDGLCLVEVDKNLGIEVMRKFDLNKAAIDLLSNPRLINIDNYSIDDLKEHCDKELLKFHLKFVSDFNDTWNIENAKGYKRFHYSLKDRIRTKKYQPLPKLRPLHKIHKNPMAYREIINMKHLGLNWYLLQLDEILAGAIGAFSKKHRFNVILENSAYMTLDLLSLKPVYDNGVFIQRTADVKALYSNLDLDDCIAAFTFVLMDVGINRYMINGCIRILEHLFNNTFICYGEKVVKIQNLIAMGWIISPKLSNIALLVTEFKSKDYWLQDLFGEYFTKNSIKLMSRWIHFDFRYIDDIYQLFEINLDFIKEEDVLNIREILQSDTESRYRDMASNIVLKALCMDQVIFLDFWICIDQHNKKILTRIHVKKQKINTYLHPESNSTYNNYFSTYASEFFRSAVINDSIDDHHQFIRQLKVNFRKRGYTFGFIRSIVSKCELDYEDRIKYLKNIRKSYIERRNRAIFTLIKHASHKYSDLLSLAEFNEFLDENSKSNEKQTFHLVKYTNRLFDRRCEERLTKATDDLVEAMDIDLDSIISGKSNTKLGHIIFK